MAEPVRHRQTKEAATDMFDLQPPRHIPTLPTRVLLTVGRALPVSCMPVLRCLSARGYARLCPAYPESQNAMQQVRII
jgi:hypothetical protein